MEQDLETAKLDTPEPSPKIEKFHVPLNSLKMMFEKGEAANNKHLPREPGKLNVGKLGSENSISAEDSEHSINESGSPDSPSKLTSQKSLEISHVLETTSSLKERMAKYQAALTKQSKPVSPTNDMKGIWNDTVKPQVRTEGECPTKPCPLQFL
ncbi:unnamed protein product [Staurois parvus]|uniref:Uncharacterized protein n=1 Tax=Staurois parvus TaxID=386267 RepID=A0ABN9B3B7_9NEOB|nr:unnamed protein product [Staurois parvus]